VSQIYTVSERKKNINVLNWRWLIVESHLLRKKEKSIKCMT